ncbi:acyl-CoA dehydrogenase family protein [Streptomyces kanamyceticus]|uniref:Medium-chain specific acyl-CoA dehydrogenase, mitochondrial n=1 Tax=Streptomyces kanamyceticus TaxID=1967 RepID=A0A5J6G4L1_STRKN|nr:acyl-CoA dehydrogenase [Streptomyces kanamyceticus]QEU89837.1 acyl-CoA dehydrogenase [Streptomyces kanamyceticus]
MIDEITSRILGRHPEQRELHARLVEFLDRHLAEPVCEQDAQPDWAALRRRAAAAGLTTIGIGSPHSAGHVAQGMAAFLAGQRDCDARELFGVGHAAMILRHGSPSLAHLVHRRAVEEGSLVGVAVSEPQSGSDLRGLRTVAVDHDDHLVLSGTKGFISRVQEAVGFVVFCKILTADSGRARARGEGEGPAGMRDVPLSAVWIPQDVPGLHHDVSPALGIRGWSFGHLELSDVRVRRDWLVGPPGRGRHVFDTHFAPWRLLMALVCLGAAAAAIEESMAHARQRHIGAGTLASLPAVVTRLGRAAAEIASATSWCFALLDDLDHGVDSSTGSAAAKALATECAYRAVDLALQLHGSEGYTEYTPMEKRLRDIRGLCIADGPNDALFSAAAHSLLRSPALVQRPKAQHDARPPAS